MTRRTRSDRTPTFWTSDPVPQLPRGQGELPFGAAHAPTVAEPDPARPTWLSELHAAAEKASAEYERTMAGCCRARFEGTGPECKLPAGHRGSHRDHVGGWWGTAPGYCRIVP